MCPQSSPGPDRSGYFSERTIAAAVTPTGGPVSIVRVSGTGARAALERLAGRADFEPRKLERARLRSADGRAFDDALVALFVAPHSFTGEDCVEFHLHGAPFIAARLLESLAGLGVRQALPGEFSFRAVRNGKLTLPQAEATADLIASSNDAAISLALEKLEGSQSRRLGELAEGLRTAATLAEAGIDFSDQDIEEVSLPALRARLAPLVAELERLRSSYRRGTMIQDGIRVAFAGLPNAGKSSFFNSLLGEDRSIVSEQAGTTRDIVRERLTLRGRLGTVTLRLEDTAGLRDAHDPVEKIGVARTARAVAHADLVLLVVDVTSDASGLAALEAEWTKLGKPRERALGILSKTDLVDEARLEAVRASLAGIGIPSWIPTSATTGAGIVDAAAQIADACERWVRRDPGELVLTRLDHAEAVGQAFEHLSRAGEASDLTLFAADLRQALAALSPLIGDTLPDDILGRVFSSFCIGK
jgi:tRNA modification GTPase